MLKCIYCKYIHIYIYIYNSNSGHGFVRIITKLPSVAPVKRKSFYYSNFPSKMTFPVKFGPSSLVFQVTSYTFSGLFRSLFLSQGCFERPEWSNSVQPGCRANNPVARPPVVRIEKQQENETYDNKTIFNDLNIYMYIYVIYLSVSLAAEHNII